MTVEELRIKYPIFEYKSFHWEIEGNNLVCSWEMEAGEIKYRPKLVIHNIPKVIDKTNLDNLVFHVGLADFFFYWKVTCSPEIRISAGKLDKDQINWWSDLLFRGMGQYFFTNKINFKAPNFVKLVSMGTTYHKKQQQGLKGVLIPVGGGKDSAVSLEILKGLDRVGAFSVNVSWADEILPASKRISEIAGIKETIFVHRQRDKKVWELKEAGYLAGHFPLSAYFYFLSALVASIFGYSAVAFSNERSSNEGNLEYLGEKINHQYSKSFEFEVKFRQYNQEYLSNVNIFSFMRPLYELQIMQIFSQPQMEKYYTQFRSCNIGYKTDSWCGKCPKCMSVFVGLFPFVKTNSLIKIFGKNLFEDESLLSLTADVLGLGNGKPFECIGTFEETIAAFWLSVKAYQGERLPLLLHYVNDNKIILEQKVGDLDKLSDRILKEFDSQNFLSEEMLSILKKNLPK